MENYYFIGIDVSKRNLECCLLSNGSVVKQDVIVNHPKSIQRYLSEICSEYCVDPNCVVICAEYTGMYIYSLTVACQSKSCKLWMEYPTQIKYSSGLQRGKNDTIDAKRIALYAFCYYDRMKVY